METGHIEVVAAHAPLAIIYDAFTPTITINGQVYKRPWGAHGFDLPPGQYTISVSYPWILAECGKSSVQVSLAAGAALRVTYTVGLIRFLPGKMTVQTLAR